MTTKIIGHVEDRCWFKHNWKLQRLFLALYLLTLGKSNYFDLSFNLKMEIKNTHPPYLLGS